MCWRNIKSKAICCARYYVEVAHFLEAAEDTVLRVMVFRQSKKVQKWLLHVLVSEIFYNANDEFRWGAKGVQGWLKKFCWSVTPARLVQVLRWRSQAPSLVYVLLYADQRLPSLSGLVMMFGLCDVWGGIQLPSQSQVPRARRVSLSAARARVLQQGVTRARVSVARAGVVSFTWSWSILW